VVLGRFDSQYLTGSALLAGHSTSSQRTGSSGADVDHAMWLLAGYRVLHLAIVGSQ
jgi:hypothetical protein